MAVILTPCASLQLDVPRTSMARRCPSVGGRKWR